MHAHLAQVQQGMRRRAKIEVGSRIQLEQMKFPYVASAVHMCFICKQDVSVSCAYVSIFIYLIPCCRLSIEEEAKNSHKSRHDENQIKPCTKTHKQEHKHADTSEEIRQRETQGEASKQGGEEGSVFVRHLCLQIASALLLLLFSSLSPSFLTMMIEMKFDISQYSCNNCTILQRNRHAHQQD